MRELGPVAQRNKEMISDEINKTIKTGKYKNISDVRKQNPSLDEFCYNNNVKTIMYSFSSQFTNQDYLELLNELEIELSKKNENDKNKTKQVIIGENVFVTGGDEKVLVGPTEITQNATNEQNTFEEQQRIKPEATLKPITDINLADTTSEEMNRLGTISNYANENGELENTKIFIDNGNISSVFKDSEGFHNIGENKEEIISNPQPTNTKVKVFKKNSITNNKAAFTNTLILSFIIGSFFGIVFLAIYIKVMH